jgi:hypothetical protein
MKKRQSNPVGPLVLEHLKKHVEGLYTYLVRDNLSEATVAKKITNDMDTHFSVFIVKWNDSLNHWMVDYNIICILKYYDGFSSWADVPKNQRSLCYKNYSANFKLLDWIIDQKYTKQLIPIWNFMFKIELQNNTVRTQHYIQIWN